ncbi:MAG: chemotaxis protein CheW [Candidatus Riflebacteria bacterium]|nr:chemotaxis protein CheW [Candidatus Riflebacteria bacterium]
MGKVFQFPGKRTVSANSRQIIVIELAGKKFGVYTDQVAEIISADTPLKKIQTAPQWIEGVVVIRGHYIPIINYFLLHNIQSEPNERNKILILNINNSYIGFIIGDILSEIAMIEPEVSLPGVEKWPFFVDRIVPLKNQQVGIINIDSLLSQADNEEIFKCRKFLGCL